MTDNEIVKALGICSKGIMFSKHDCKKCPYYAELCCERKLKENALDLINRQKEEKETMQHYIDHLQAEIERLKKCREEEVYKIVSAFDKVICETKSEARKEFAERLIELGVQEGAYEYVSVYDIDNLLIEMESESNVD